MIRTYQMAFLIFRLSLLANNWHRAVINQNKKNKIPHGFCPDIWKLPWSSAETLDSNTQPPLCLSSDPCVQLNKNQPVTVHNVLQILRLHVSVPQCDVFGYLSIDHELVVLIAPVDQQPTPLQVTHTHKFTRFRHLAISLHIHICFCSFSLQCVKHHLKST